MTRIPYPLPRGTIPELARLIGRPSSTVRNWQRYRLPVEERPGVVVALEKIERERRELIERQRRPVFRLGGRPSENPRQNHRS